MNRNSLLVLLAAGLVAIPLAAQAHAHLAQAVPANDSVVSAAPDHFLLSFSESAHLTALTIQKEGEAKPQKIVSLPKGASEHFTIPAPKLGAGVYTLTYRVIAADDNHLTSGMIRFTVLPDGKPTGGGAGK